MSLQHERRDGIPAHPKDIFSPQCERSDIELIEHGPHRTERMRLGVHEGPVHVEQDPIDIVEVHVAMLLAAFSISACRRPEAPGSRASSAMDAWSSRSLAKGSGSARPSLFSRATSARADGWVDLKHALSTGPTSWFAARGSLHVRAHALGLVDQHGWAVSEALDARTSATSESTAHPCDQRERLILGLLLLLGDLLIVLWQIARETLFSGVPSNSLTDMATHSSTDWSSG